ncbi:MAG: hypothetical protein RIB86_14700, partial [Imperialibacter sp.]
LVFSVSGVFGWKIWEPFAVIACILIGIIQLVSLIETQIITSDDDLVKISELRLLYLEYLLLLEKLWTEFDAKTVSEPRALEQFFSLRKELKLQIEAKDNELHINGNIESLLRKADTIHLTYLENRYGQTI